jgi:hypothetical protein
LAGRRLNAGNQVEPPGKVVVLADGRHQPLEFGSLPLLETGDLLLPELPEIRVTTGFAAVLELGNVVSDLIDQRLVIGQRHQAGIRWRMDRLGRGRAGRDQVGVDLVVLGPLQMKPGIGPHLDGLKHDHHEPVAAQLGHHSTLVAAARLDADPLHTILTQQRRQCRMAVRSVVEAPPLGDPADRHVELGLASVDTDADYVRLAHLPRPFLV